MRVLVTGWSSFVHGEATAGDVLSMRRVGETLAGAGIPYETAWSPGFRPEALHLDDADSGRYSHLVFVCGPAHGEQVRTLHERYASCRRIAVGVTVVDPADATVTGFHRVLPRDDPGTARPDMSVSASTGTVPVIGVVFAPGQAEYGPARRHRSVHEALERWLNGLDCARLPLDTRLAGDDWRHCRTPDQLASVFARLDAVVTTRLHGLVFALRAGVPVLAVDPVAGGGKVTAQAAALGWPALIPAEQALDTDVVDHWWEWCLSAAGRKHARRNEFPAADSLASALLDELLPGRSA
ncbi:polysaccharide pyruvyl transferase family protein [Nocardia carnea]|uniref:Polysaccharide pyruvyl transferase family protein n=1 Tax=Nocardia carnea TaxID=37328 RepID=A0ABW7TH86_9NOCA|nr:polysaccharide pyruvyl transferase family protein [Nocardia carnea]